MTIATAQFISSREIFSPHDGLAAVNESTHHLFGECARLLVSPT